MPVLPWRVLCWLCAVDVALTVWLCYCPVKREGGNWASECGASSECLFCSRVPRITPTSRRYSCSPSRRKKAADISPCGQYRGTNTKDLLYKGSARQVHRKFNLFVKRTHHLQLTFFAGRTGNIASTIAFRSDMTAKCKSQGRSQDSKSHSADHRHRCAIQRHYDGLR